MSIKQDRTGARTPADLERKYAFGQTFAEVYALVADAQKAANEANKAVESLDHAEIFNRLTNYGEWQGVYRDGDNIYMNASYIKSGVLAASLIDADNLKVKAANITGSLSAGSVSTFMANVTGEFIAGKITAGALDAKILEVDAAKITGLLSAENIDTDKLYVDAANVYGTLSANDVEISGALSVYDSWDDYCGSIGYITSWGYNGRTYGVGIESPVADDGGQYWLVVSDSGARLTGEHSEILCAGSIWLETDNDIKANQSITETSDRRAKDDIQYNVCDYLAVFDTLKPATFVWLNRKDKRRHLGMIAQEVEESVLAAGIAKEDFAPLSIDEYGTYGLAYTEFIPLLIAKVQQLDAEVKELKQNG